MQRLLATLAGLVATLNLAAGSAAAATAPAFANWAAVVVSGDFHAAHTNNPTETFDNARRDVSAELIHKGFSATNLREFSVRPQNYPDVKPGKSDLQPVYETLKNLATQATGGCLLYITSHGAPQGVVMDGQLIPPQLIDQVISDACPHRPAIVIISACFSGVFVPALAAPDRMVLTAARPDRSSFGCSESDKYPYFDACMLEVLPQAHDFVALAPKVQACVARREQEINASPPSEPQVSIGAQLRFLLPLMVLQPG